MAGNVENFKVSLGVLFVVLLQGGAFVWWTAQQASTLEQLAITVGKLEQKIDDGKLVIIQRDIKDLHEDIEVLQKSMTSMQQLHYNDMRGAYDKFKEHENMITYSATIDELNDVIDDLEELEGKLEDIGIN